MVHILLPYGVFWKGGTPNHPHHGWPWLSIESHDFWVSTILWNIYVGWYSSIDGSHPIIDDTYSIIDGSHPIIDDKYLSIDDAYPIIDVSHPILDE